MKRIVYSCDVCKNDLTPQQIALAIKDRWTRVQVGYEEAEIHVCVDCSKLVAATASVEAVDVV